MITKLKEKISKMIYLTSAKYVKSQEGEIIVFPPYMKHSSFASFKPTSAGTISFGVDEKGKMSCICYGDSHTLRLTCDEEDTFLAKKQILGIS